MYLTVKVFLLKKVTAAVTTGTDLVSDPYKSCKAIALPPEGFLMHVESDGIPLVGCQTEVADILKDTHGTAAVSFDSRSATAAGSAYIVEECRDDDTLRGNCTTVVKRPTARLEGVLRQSAREMVVAVAACAEECAAKKVVDGLLCTLAARFAEEADNLVSYLLSRHNSVMKGRKAIYPDG